MCTWFEEIETGTYRMRRSENHCYLPLKNTCVPCRDNTSLSTKVLQIPKQITQYPLRSLFLQQNVNKFILHSIGKGMTNCGSQALNHESESLQGTQQTVQHVITIDETPEHQKIPKWLTVNHINLIKMPLQAMNG